MTHDQALRAYREDGLVVFAPDPGIRAFAEGCTALVPDLLADPDHAAWHRCKGSWFAGVNALPNGPDGAIPGKVPPPEGAALAFIREALGFAQIAWDRAQVSVAFPGYPLHGAEDTEASHRYRVKRCAAHVDGLERDADRRRKLSETHSFLLGIPLGPADPHASAFVLWRGSHEIMRAAFRDAFTAIPPDRWRGIDITDTYVAARRRCFEECEMIEIAPGLGSSYVMHPLALHGIAPWREGARVEHRAVAYFRPDLFGGDAAQWLTA